MPSHYPKQIYSLKEDKDPLMAVITGGRKKKSAEGSQKENAIMVFLFKFNT